MWISSGTMVSHGQIPWTGLLHLHALIPVHFTAVHSISRGHWHFLNTWYCFYLQPLALAVILSAMPVPSDLPPTHPETPRGVWALKSRHFLCPQGASLSPFPQHVLSTCPSSPRAINVLGHDLGLSPQYLPTFWPQTHAQYMFFKWKKQVDEWMNVVHCLLVCVPKNPVLQHITKFLCNTNKTLKIPRSGAHTQATAWGAQSSTWTPEQAARPPPQLFRFERSHNIQL